MLQNVYRKGVLFHGIVSVPGGVCRGILRHHVFAIDAPSQYHLIQRIL